MKKSCVIHKPSEDVIVITRSMVAYAGEDKPGPASTVIAVLYSRFLKGKPLSACASMMGKECVEHYAERSFRKILRGMVNKGQLSVARLSAEDIADRLTQNINPPTGTNRYCQWCKSPATVLHGHHYPIPRRRGGEDLVYICRKCHEEFHYLVDNTFYSPTKDTIDLFESIGLTYDEVFGGTEPYAVKETA